MMTTRSSLEQAMRAVLFLFLFIVSGCENMGGERTVSGKEPLESETVEAERIADSLATPKGSVLLETRITSKAELGVVTKKYSTSHDCEEIDSFFRDHLISIGWQYLNTEKRGFLGLDMYSSFSRNGFKIEVSCGELKDYKGIRKFYLTCSW